MERISIKARETFEQSGLALYEFLLKKGVESELILNDGKPSKNAKVLDLNKHCVNTSLFKPDDESRFLDTMYFGDFSIENMDSLIKKTNKLEIGNLHVYSENRWPIHNFIGILTYRDLGELSQMYKSFISLENDPDWVYMSFVYSGCKPLIEKDIKVYTVEEYAKELGLE